MNQNSRCLALILYSCLLLGAHDMGAQNFFKWFKKTNKESIEHRLDAESFFIEGNKEFNLENYNKALPLFEKTLTMQPKSAATNFKIAECLAKLGNTTQAINFSKNALALDPHNKYYYVLLAELYESKKLFPEAIEVLERLLKIDNHSNEFYFDLAALYAYSNKMQEAIDVLDKAEQIYGVSEEMTMQKQQLYLKINKLDKVIEEGQKLISAFPSENRYKLELAEILINNEKLDLAASILTTVLDNDKDEPLARLLFCDLYKAKGDNKRAEEELDLAFQNIRLSSDDKINMIVDLVNSGADEETKSKSLKLAEITAKVHPDDAKAVAVLADMLLINNKKKESLTEYLRALKLNSGVFKIWQQAITIDAELNLTDSLIKHSSQAIELYPNQALAWFYNGTGNLIKKDYTKAVYSLEEAKKLGRDQDLLLGQVNAQLGDAYNGLKNYPKSDAAYEEVLSKDAENYHVLNNYSYFLSLRKEKLEYAKQLCQKVIEAYPDEPTYLDTYGWILYVMKDYAGAKVYLEKAMTKTENGAITEHYGDVLFQIGQKEKALEYWKSAKKQGDTSGFIDKKIADKILYE
jgi:tetratricopeptide (TPR) repeat protein